MPNDDPKVAAAKAALSHAQHFTNSAVSQAGVARSDYESLHTPPAHDLGKAWATSHGNNHEGNIAAPGNPGETAASINSNIAQTQAVNSMVP